VRNKRWNHNTRVPHSYLGCSQHAPNEHLPIAIAREGLPPDFFLEDTPTAVLVRQVLGAIAQFDKATERNVRRLCALTKWGGVAR
jgi:hypothetical protein